MTTFTGSSGPIGANFSVATQRQLVAITGLDLSNPALPTAQGYTNQNSYIPIDLRNLVGAVHVTPAIGEQWYVNRGNQSWVLDSKLPFNTDVLNNVAANPVPGQVQIGSSGPGAGPLQLAGSAINANAPLQLFSGAVSGVLPPGTITYNNTTGQVEVSDGTSSGPIAVPITPGSITMADLGTGTPSSTTWLRGDGTWSPLPPDDDTGSMIWRGNFDDTATYNPDDVVFYAGNSYIAIVPVAPGGGPPDTNAAWHVLSTGSTGGGTTTLPLTTKGDLLTMNNSATLVRLGVGSDGQILTADSSQPTGLVWQAIQSSQLPLLSDMLGTLLPAQIPLLSDLLGILSIGQIPSLPQSQIINLANDLLTLNTSIGDRALQSDLISLVNALGEASFGSVAAALPVLITRLENLTLGGLFDAAALTNIANISPIPQSQIINLVNDLLTLNTSIADKALQSDLLALANSLSLGTFSTVASAITALTPRFANLGSGGLFDASALTNIANIPAGIPQTAVDLVNIPAGIVSGVLSYTNIPALNTLSGSLNPSQIAAGALPAGVTSSISQIVNLTGYLTNLNSLGVYGAALPISQIISLGGYLTNLSPLGVLALGGLALGALPVGITIAGAAITGVVAASIISGALTGATLGVTELTGLAAGILTWLTGGGALPTGTTMGATGLTGLATGIGTWLTGGGALPAATTLAGSQLTGSVAASLVSGVLSGATLAASALTSGVIPTGVTLDGGQVTGLLGSAQIPSLPSGWTGTVAGNLISGITANEQVIADQIFGASNQSSGQPLTQIQSALQQFPFGNLAGSPGNTGTGPLQGLADSMLQGLTNVPVVGNTLAQVSNFLSGMANQLYGYTPASPPLTSVAGTTTANSQTLAQMANTRSVSHAIAPTGDATFDLALLSGATLPTLAVTQGKSVIGFIRTPTGANPNTPMTLWPMKQAVAWKSSGYTGSITGLWINIYKYNTVTGKMDLWNQSPNLVGGIANSLNYYFYNIISDQPYLPSIFAFQGIPYCQTDVWAVEMQISGTGTYQLAGLQMNHASYPGVLPPYMAAYRGSGTTVPSPPEELTPAVDFFYQTPSNVPWFSLTGSAGATTYAPQQIPFTTPGSFTYTVPKWAQFIDYAIMPAGGGGGGGVNAWGNGGRSGQWIFGTLQVGGSNGPSAGATITGTVGAGGPGGSSEAYGTDAYGGGVQWSPAPYALYATSGNAGGASSIQFASPSGTQTISAPGGLGGTANGGSYPGQGASNQTYNGGSYYGGAEQDGETLVNGSAPAYNGYGGNSPGGGGSGCYSGSGRTGTNTLTGGAYYGVNGAQPGGPGGDGAIFLVVYAPNPVPLASTPFAPVQGQINVAIPRAATR
jgi:hypothetical protein